MPCPGEAVLAAIIAVTTMSAGDVVSDQANVPAKQPPTEQDPRLPLADANPCWACDHRRASTQRPQSPCGLTAKPVDLVLARAHRLRSSGDYGLTIRHGRRCSTRTVVVYALVEGATELPRIGLVVSQALGIAVERNKVKRRLRAIVRAQLPCLPGGRVVIRALPAAASADFRSLAADVRHCVGQLKEATS